GVSVRNNVIYKVNAVGIKVYDSQDLAGIYNNTLSSCGGVGIQAYPAVSVMNNLVFGNNGGSSQVSLGGGSSCDYNAYSGTWGDPNVGSSSLNLSSTDLDNTLTSASSGNFSLKSTAVVIGKAKVMSGFSNDVMNNSRGSSWDIGAYEYAGQAPAPSDSTPPSVALSAPANNATVSGSSVTISANASDNVGVAGVQFKLDGANLGAEDGSASYSVSWNTTSVANGTHTLTAVARDAAGNQTTSAAATVTVSNSTSTGNNVVWVEDAVPAGAQSVAGYGNEAWTWVGSSPTPYSGAKAHQSIVLSGLHNHYFYGATATLSVGTGDKLFAYVYLDPSNPPSEVMLHWNDGSWEHRAYWGANNITTYGTDGTPGRYYAGALPAAGQWARLEVPASAVALEGSTLNGMGFSLYGGRATWDAAGKSSSGSTTTLPTVTVTASDANASEANRDPGVFTIARTGSTSASLTVNYTLGGTAGNGADYNALSGAVTIPAGAALATVTITPVDDTLVEGSEAVVLSVAANAAYTV